MNATRLWTFGSVVVIIALLAGTWFIGISPKLDEASTANTDRSSVEAQNVIQAATVASLKEKAEKLDELKAELEGLHKAVPTQANLSTLIGQINSMAINTGVSVSQFTSSEALGYLPVDGQELDPELAASVTSVGAENFFVIPVGMNLTGEYGAVMEFVRQLQSGDRLVLVHGLSLAKGSAVAGEAVEISLTGQTFVFLDSIAPVAEVPVAEATGEAAAG